MTDPARDTDATHSHIEALRAQFVARALPERRGLRLPSWLHHLHRRPVPVSRRLPLAGATMAFAAAIIAVVVALGASGTDAAPAYAVTFRDSNTITISLHEWSAIGRLNARLKSLGMRIRVVPIVSGCVAPVHQVIYAHEGVPTHVEAGPARTLLGGTVSRPFTLLTTWNDTLPGHTRIFTATRSGQWGAVYTVVGPAPRCVDAGR